MPFRRDNFHNSRTYEADPPTPAPSGFSAAFAWVKLQFDKLLRSGAPSPMPYSLLGSDVRDRPSDKTESTAFPMVDREPGFQTSMQPARANGMRRQERQAER